MHSLRAAVPLLLLSTGLFAASVVTVNKTAAGFELLRNGSPYFVKGAGGQYRPGEIASCGGNSIRTWGTDDKILDTAQAHGLTVTMGLWDPTATAALAAVAEYKDHTALLLWGLGNEMESRASDDVALWKSLNAIALQMKQADPNHPVMTVVAEINATKVQQIQENYTAIDILGVNSYGGVGTVADRLAQYGWTKAYMITELGPRGHWEVGKTSWGVPIEQTSTTKADFYLQGYQKSIVGKSSCLGSYVFLWGYKQEKTHTWYGMFLPEDIGGGRTGAVDAMTFAWTSAWPANRCPTLGDTAIVVDKKHNPGDGSNRFAPQSTILCRVRATDPEGKAITVTWDLRKDVALNPATGGSAEPANPPVAGSTASSSGDSVRITLPATDGMYRVHVYVRDAAGSAATANLPIVVDKAVPKPVRTVTTIVTVSRSAASQSIEVDALGRHVPHAVAAPVRIVASGATNSRWETALKPH